MPLIMCTKFQINRIILTLFSGVWDKNPTPVDEKVVKCRRPIGLRPKFSYFLKKWHFLAHKVFISDFLVEIWNQHSKIDPGAKFQIDKR